MNGQSFRNVSNIQYIGSDDRRRFISMRNMLIILVVIPVLMSVCATQITPIPTVRQVSVCPESGSVVSLTKVMNPSFIHDYQGCDMVVDATFLKTGNEGYMLGQYDTSNNTTFQVLAPGSAAQIGFGGMSFGIYAGIPKEKSDVLFELKPGEKIQLRGAPIGYYAGGNLVVGVFHTTSVTRK